MSSILKQFRVKYNLTQRQLAEVCHVKVGTIETLEQQGAAPRPALKTRQRLVEGMAAHIAAIQKSPEAIIYHVLTETLGGIGRYTTTAERETVARRIASVLAGQYEPLG